MKEILIAVAIVLIIVIPLSVIWIKGIDEALQDDTWKKVKEDEDREQAEYLRRYMERKQAKKRRKKQMFLLWIRRR